MRTNRFLQVIHWSECLDVHIICGIHFFVFHFRRLRTYQPESSPFKLQVDSLNVSNSGVEGTLLNTNTGVQFSFLLQFLVDATVRLRINEEKVMRHRYQPLQALIAEPIQFPWVLSSKLFIIMFETTLPF